MKTLLLLICLSCYLALPSVGNEIDSLENLLKQPEITGNSRVKVYLRLAGRTFRQSPRKAVEYLKAAELVDVSEDPMKYGPKLNARLVQYCRLAGDYQEALAYAGRNEAMYQKAWDDLAQPTDSIKRVLYKQYYLNNCYYHSAEVYHKIGAYEQSLAYYLMAREGYELLGSQGGISATYNNIAVIYLEGLQNTELALRYFQKSYSLNKETASNPEKITYGLDRNMANNEANIGEAYLTLGNYDSALFYTKKAYDRTRFNRPNDRYQLSMYAVGLGDIFHARGRLDSALYYVEFAYGIQKDNFPDPIDRTMLTLSELYFEKQDFEKAAVYARQAYAIGQESAVHNTIYQSAGLMSRILKAQQRYKESLTFLETAQVYKDSVFQLQSSEEIAHMNAQFVLEEQERENQLLKQKSALTKARMEKQYLIGVVLLVITLAMVAVAMLLYKRGKVKQELAAQKIKYEQRQKEYLEKELQFKDQELTNFAFQIVEKNNFMAEVTYAVEQVKKKGLQQHTALNELIKKLKSHDLINRHQTEFDAHVNSIYDAFYNKLDEVYAGLTQKEKRLAALLRLELSSKEISAITGISAKSVDMNR